MAIILNDFKPSGNNVEIQFPGASQRYTIPTSDVLTGEDLELIDQGKFTTVLAQYMPAEAIAEFRKLHLPQIKDFFTGWLGDPKA